MTTVEEKISRWRDEIDYPYRYTDWWNNFMGYIEDDLVFRYDENKNIFYDECGFEVFDILQYLIPSELEVFLAQKKDRDFLRKNNHPSPWNPEIYRIILYWGW